jgi:SAM-dependent methyltransferase
MAEPFRILDLGDRRVLETDGHRYPTRYSARVIRMLVERKGPHRAPLYFDFKETRGRHFLGPLFAHLRSQGRHGLRVLEVGCSFGHMTEFLAEQPEVTSLATFDTDAAFVELTRAKVDELGLDMVREVRHLDQSATCALPWADGAFDLVVAVGVIEHLPERYRRQQVDEYYRVLAAAGSRWRRTRSACRWCSGCRRG